MQMFMPHSGERVSVRVGINTGPCVSGLIGNKVPKWTILGDSVNTAARLEQNCPPNMLQLSQATYSLLPGGEQQALVPTGGVYCKGKV